MPELAHVFETASVTAALSSVLGEGYLMHGHRCELICVCGHFQGVGVAVPGSENRIASKCVLVTVTDSLNGVLG